VHSLLVGPSTGRALAEPVDGSGWTTTVSDLGDALDLPESFASRAAQHGHAVDVVLGHSGAGVVLPIVLITQVVPRRWSSSAPSHRRQRRVPTGRGGSSSSSTTSLPP
jgi:hypothetical protein